MDAAKALANLKELSTQLQQAVVFGADGSVLAATVDDGRAAEIARAASRLLEAASGDGGGKPIVQLEASFREGSVVIVRDGERAVAATTVADPTVGLVFYDLRTCLREVAEAESKPKPKPRPRKRAAGADAESKPNPRPKPRRKKAEPKDADEAA